MNNVEHIPIDELRATLRIDGQPEGALVVLGFGGTETMSDLSEYVLLVGSSAEVAEGLDEALGRHALFVIHRGGNESSAYMVRGRIAEIHPGGVTAGNHPWQTGLVLRLRLDALSHRQEPIAGEPILPYRDEGCDLCIDHVSAIARPRRIRSSSVVRRLEAQRSVTFSGTTNCLRVRVGRVFEINDHPNTFFNRKYTVTKTTLRSGRGYSMVLGRSDRSSGLSIDFCAISADFPTSKRTSVRR